VLAAKKAKKAMKVAGKVRRTSKGKQKVTRQQEDDKSEQEEMGVDEEEEEEDADDNK